MTVKRNWKWTALMCLLAGVAFAPGCTDDAGDAKKPTDDAHSHSHDGHDHDDHDDHGDHDHDDHDHGAEKMGEHGGHIADFTDGEGAFEWTHNDNANKVTIYLLGEDETTLTPAEGAKCTVVLTSGEKTKEFELPAIDEADGKAATFQLEDPSLIAALQMGVTVKVTTAEGEKSAVIKPHVH